MANNTRKIVKNLSEKIGQDGFFQTLNQYMNDALKCRDLHLLKKLKDLEWKHFQAVRGELKHGNQ